MLSRLTIRNLALVDSVSIEFRGGLNVITGETGAGKSLLIGALRLLLGERADKSMIRTGERRGARGGRPSAVRGRIAHHPSHDHRK